VLGLDLQLDHGALRFVDLASGQRLLTYREAELARRAAEERARQEAMAREAAEARIAALEVQLRALQNKG